MVTVLKWIGILLLVVLVLLVVVGFLLPADYRIERSIVIENEAGQVHYFVGDLQRWPEWTPWQEMDPTIQTVYGERTTGVGAHQAWHGDSGGGELTFTRCDPATGVAYDMVFDEDDDKTLGSLDYEKVAGGTRVSWTMSGSFGNNIIGRYFGLMMDSMIGTMFEDGLKKLKVRVEELGPAEVPAETPAEPPADSPAEIEDAAA